MMDRQHNLVNLHDARNGNANYRRLNFKTVSAGIVLIFAVIIATSHYSGLYLRLGDAVENRIQMFFTTIIESILEKKIEVMANEHYDRLSDMVKKIEEKLINIGFKFDSFKKETILRLNEQQMTIRKISSTLNVGYNFQISAQNFKLDEFFDGFFTVKKNSPELYDRLQNLFDISNCGLWKVGSCTYNYQKQIKMNLIYVYNYKAMKGKQPVDVDQKGNYVAMVINDVLSHSCFLYSQDTLSSIPVVQVVRDRTCHGIAISQKRRSFFVSESTLTRSCIVEYDVSLRLDAKTKSYCFDSSTEPKGIAINPVNEQIYVVDPGKHRVVVLNPNPGHNKIIFLFSFGEEGAGRGKLLQPEYIAVDKEGFVYVTDSMRHCVLKFFINGTFIDEFGSYGSFPGQLNKPKGIAVDSYGAVYVAEEQRISIFDADGNFIHYITYMNNRYKIVLPSNVVAVGDNDYLVVPDISMESFMLF
jgi:DNA-binding beta-propeller fold protein YncE